MLALLVVVRVVVEHYCYKACNLGVGKSAEFGGDIVKSAGSFSFNLVHVSPPCWGDFDQADMLAKDYVLQWQSTLIIRLLV